uniref:Polyketide synthase n=1 Tax=Peronospora matthiolae TaxID=2874970 RepID=A0AAV1VIB9_9STRA
MFLHVTNAVQDALCDAWVTESVTVTGLPRVSLHRRHNWHISSFLRVQ